MKLVLESAGMESCVARLDTGGDVFVESRRWVGTAGAGGESVPVEVYIVRIAVAREHEAAFEALRARDPHILDRGVGDTANGPSRARASAIDARLLR